MKARSYDYMGQAVKEKLKNLGFIPWIFILAENIITLIIASKVSIHLPYTDIPFTFQSLFVAFIGMVYGVRTGILGVTGFLLLGLLGLPVFSGSGAGVDYFAGPAGGFLVSFLPAVALAGFFAQIGWHKSFRMSVLAFLLTQVFILSFGMWWWQQINPGQQDIVRSLLSLSPGLAVKTITGAFLIRLFWYWLNLVQSPEKPA